MDLNYAPEDLAFRQATRRWFAEHTSAVEPKTLAERKAWHRKMYDVGYIGMLWPKEYGGRGATPMQQAIVQDEMARASAPPPINGLGIGFIGPTIIVHGTEAQKQRYLQKMLTAEEIWCQLYSEPNAGSDLAGLKTRADDAGDHMVVIRTEIGLAQPTALTIDRARIAEVVGTIAGDDTIFIAVKNQAAQRLAMTKISRLLSPKSRTRERAGYAAKRSGGKTTKARQGRGKSATR